MKSCVLFASVLVVLLATTCALAKNAPQVVTTHHGDRTSTRIIIRREATETADSDDPEPPEYFLMMTNNCKGNMVLNKSSVGLTNGTWAVEPSDTIYGGGNSGGFVVKHGPHTHEFNGTATYTLKHLSGSWHTIHTDFECYPNDQWIVGFVYPTIAKMTIGMEMNEIGTKHPKAFYTAVFGGFALPEGEYSC